MTSQPPLLDQTGASLPGPQFTPRPGWGGQLGRWFSDNAYVVVFRLVIIFALVLVARSLWLHLPSRQIALSPTPSASSQDLRSLTITAKAGDGMTHLAARAINLYIAMQTGVIRLDAAQHLFAVDTLARTTCWCALDAGQSVSFTTVNISAAVESALHLTPAQHSAWLRLLR